MKLRTERLTISILLLAGVGFWMAGPEAWGQSVTGATATNPPAAVQDGGAALNSVPPAPGAPAAAGSTAVAPRTPPPHLEIPEIPARPEDVGSIDGIVAAFYDVITGPAGQPRQWARDRTLYIPKVQFVSVVGVRPDGTTVYRLMDHEFYADHVNPGFVEHGFFEREIHRVVHRFDDIAHVFSTYESRASAGGPVVARGVNSLDLFFDGKRWWIAFASWEGERPGSSIPKELLP